MKTETGLPAAVYMQQINTRFVPSQLLTVLALSLPSGTNHSGPYKHFIPTSKIPHLAADLNARVSRASLMFTKFGTIQHLALDET
jgi:hypothetical protein